jgi:hypothetical protein
VKAPNPPSIGTALSLGSPPLLTCTETSNKTGIASDGDGEGDGETDGTYALTSAKAKM